MADKKKQKTRQPSETPANTKATELVETKPLTPAEQQTAHAAYGRFLDAASALPRDKVLAYGLWPDLAIRNVATAMKVFAAHEHEIPEHLPKVDVAAIRGLPSLALATKFAALQAAVPAPSDHAVSEAITQARKLRGVLLPVLGGLAATGLVPQKDYVAITKGNGTRDIAEDCARIPAVFAEHEVKIRGQHSATPKMLQDCAEVGAFLLTHLRPVDAPPTTTAPSPAAETRDRLATLLRNAYSALEVVAHYFHRDDWRERVPPLGSHAAPPRPAPPKTPPTQQGGGGQ